MCSSYCLSLFSVINQFAVVNILAEYSNPSPRRMNKVAFLLPSLILQLITRSIIVPLIVYILVGWYGYESTGSNTPDVIVNRTVAPDTGDVLMQIGKSGTSGISL